MTLKTTDNSCSTYLLCFMSLLYLFYSISTQTDSRSLCFVLWFGFFPGVPSFRFSTEMRTEPAPGPLHCFNEYKVFHKIIFYIRNSENQCHHLSTESVQLYYHSSSLWNSVGLYPSFTDIMGTTLVIYFPLYFLCML